MDDKVKVFRASIHETHISFADGTLPIGCASTTIVRVSVVYGYLISCLDGVSDRNLIETLSELDWCGDQHGVR